MIAVLIAAILDQPGFDILIVSVEFFLMICSEQCRMDLDIAYRLLVVYIVIHFSKVNGFKAQVFHDGSDIIGTVRIDQDVMVRHFAHAILGISHLEPAGNRNRLPAGIVCYKRQRKTARPAGHVLQGCARCATLD